MPAIRTEQEVTSTAESVGPLRRWIEELCTEGGATARQCADVALAVSEALSNVVMHAYVDRSDPGPLRLRTERTDRRLLIEVEDVGVGMRPRLDSPGGGLGLALIATLADELQFTRGPSGTGTLVRMTFPLG